MPSSRHRRLSLKTRLANEKNLYRCRGAQIRVIAGKYRLHGRIVVKQRHFFLGRLSTGTLPLSHGFVPSVLKPMCPRRQS